MSCHTGFKLPRESRWQPLVLAPCCLDTNGFQKETLLPKEWGNGSKMLHRHQSDGPKGFRFFHLMTESGELFFDWEGFLPPWVAFLHFQTMKPFQVLMTVSLNSRGHAAHPFISSPGSKHVFLGSAQQQALKKNPGLDPRIFWQSKKTARCFEVTALEFSVTGRHRFWILCKRRHDDMTDITTNPFE